MRFERNNLYPPGASYRYQSRRKSPFYCHSDSTYHRECIVSKLKHFVEHVNRQKKWCCLYSDSRREKARCYRFPAEWRSHYECICRFTKESVKLVIGIGKGTEQCCPIYRTSSINRFILNARPEFLKLYLQCEV